MRRDFTMDDYAQMLIMCERRWPSHLNGMPGIEPTHGIAGYSSVPRICAMIAAMTSPEQVAPNHITAARYAEIASTAQVEVCEVERLVAEFIEYRNRMANVKTKSWWGIIKMAFGWDRIPSRDEDKR